MATIAVIEDAREIADAVAARLRSEGHRVEIASDGPSGVALCLELEPDLVVLDLMLPGFDGLEVCRRVQSHRPVPVLMLTAKGTETDMVVGLEVGADDYLTKPFSPRELVARVRALLRRSDRAAELATEKLAAEHRASGPIEVGRLNLDIARRRAHIGPDEVHLTPIEFDLVAALAAHPGTVFTREQLLRDVWGYPDGSGARTVDSHVRSVRSKLGDGVIRTVHGVGYALEESP